MLLDDAKYNISAAANLVFLTRRVGGEPCPSEAHWQITASITSRQILNLKPLELRGYRSQIKFILALC
jgi:hypothetical protein